MLILFVDDDPEEFELFCDAIKATRPKAQCLHAINGQAALQALTELVIPPDYIFLDINMPIMNGREFLENMKADNSLNEIPVFIYSTTSNIKEQQMFLSLGANRFITKPNNFYHLVRTLNAILMPVK